MPIFKEGDHNKFSNYRPISVLTYFSKLLERLTYNRLLSYLNRFKLLNDIQYGFRQNHSTYMALLSLIDTLTNNFDNGETTIGIFLDLSKAFDTVNHSILTNKLYHYGIRGTSNNWFSNYLKNRFQCVHVNDTNSSYSEIHCGVPQGSILGPILFILYINDLSNSSKLSNFILFADDTNIFLKDKDPSTLSRTVNAELIKIQHWFMCNKLSLNVKKSHYMLFNTRQTDANLIKINSFARVSKLNFWVYI